MGNFKEDIANVKAFAFDCDGVLTDGSLMMTESGQLIRVFNAKDGYAIVKALAANYPVAIISGGSGDVMEMRFKKLGITDLYLGSLDKLNDIDDFRYKYGFEREDILYVGDDVPDIEPMMNVGLSVAPSDAVLEVKAIARHVSEYGGGKGCVRDVIEQVLKARGDWSVECKNIQ